MFKLFYSLSIKIYYVLIAFASLFNKKAKLWIKGRKKIFKKIDVLKKVNDKKIWFHSSSLGEFEQARPLIEKIKTQYPNYKIIVTFFSPSGYEFRKNYKFADYIFYLPIDSNRNAKKFIEALNPSITFFVKYDFWYFYIRELHKKQIPTYLVSGIFRQNQIFFKPYGKAYAKILKNFTHLFVQNEKSTELLKSIEITNSTIAGDTRFDRVIEIADNSQENELIKKFVNDKFCIIAGSSWYEDEQLLSRFINEHPDVKMIIAPHVINENHIVNILQIIHVPVVRYSRAKLENVGEYSVMIIDNIGMLAGLYKYGNLAYIGGGFGAGIHNIIEAAVYGMPVIFGTNYKKFQEALDLIELKAAYPIADYDELSHYLSMFIRDANFLKHVSEIAYNYVRKNKGATDKILAAIDFDTKPPSI